MTTAGSLALDGWYAPRDAPLVARLRAAGAVILGKTNLSEWANFRSGHSSGGWSGRGGQTHNTYALDRSDVTVPAGLYRGLPVGLSFFGTAFSEPKLIKLASGFEHTANGRAAPHFLAGI